MDYVNEWLDVAQQSLTPSTIKTIYDYTNILRSYTFLALSYIQRYLLSNPSLGTIALFLLLLVISLKVLDMAVSMIRFWVRMVFRVAFYGGMAVLGFWVYTRGPQGVVNDCMDMYEFWGDQGRHFKRKAEAQRRIEQGRRAWY